MMKMSINPDNSPAETDTFSFADGFSPFERFGEEIRGFLKVVWGGGNKGFPSNYILFFKMVEFQYIFQPWFY